MKKKLCILLAALIATSAFTACGSSTASTETTSATSAVSDKPEGTPPDGAPPEGSAPGAPPDGAGGPGGGPGGSSADIDYSGATEITSADSQEGQTYESSTVDQSALLISTSEDVSVTGATVTKSGSSNGGDDCNFYGLNAAVLAKDGANVTISGTKITSDAAGANGVFSYGGNGGQNGAAGDGTTVTISDSTITTTGSGSGGIMTTGGGVTMASNLKITTSGQSSAAIRTDRGGGTVTVDGGTYTTHGLGSPSIYSTADITVSNATLVSTKSEGVCIEGKNSITLKDCDLTADNTSRNGNATFLDTIMIYQSMSGDADSGTSSFTMSGGSLTSKSGHVFHVTNTNAIITLNGVSIINEDADNVLLSVCDDGWSGADNIATLNASHQTLTGDLLVGSDSKLTMTLSDGSTFTGSTSGSITDKAGTTRSTSIGTVNLTVNSGCTWKLTGDSTVTSLSGSGTIDYNGHTLTVNGTDYTAANPYSGMSSADSSSSGSAESGNTDSGNTDSSTVSLADAEIADIADQTYTGKALKPAVTVTLNGKTLTKGTDYTVSYKNNKKAGTATVTVTGTGDYTGTVTKSFQILPTKTTLSSVKNAKGKKLTVKWTKNKSGTGYEIQYSTSKDFKSGVKTVKVSGNSTTSKTISGLTKGKTCYVRIRTVNGSVKSGWSAKKSVTIQK